MATVYHLLDEAEVFSEHRGGAISRWAANVLRKGSEIVICPAFDSSWRFPVDRIFQLPNWGLTDPIHPVLYRLPWSLQRSSYLGIFMLLRRKLRPGDVLYVHNRPECAAALATDLRKTGVHLILHMHNSHLIRANKGQLNALRHTPIVFCSQFLRDEAATALPGHFKDVHVVYNGADQETFRSVRRIAQPLPTVVYTGRLVPYKGVHVLLDAMRLLEKWSTQVRCRILGGSGFGGSPRTWYIRRLERLKPSNTEFLGYKIGRELVEELQRSDIFCCPSIWHDPFPLAPIEAMATGLPVVASRTGGLRETLAHGGGVLVPSNNPDALARAIDNLVKDVALREKLGAEAKASVESHFLWSNVREQYERVLRSVAS